jgi:serine/threonine protein kinase
MFLVGIAGPHLTVSGAIFTERFVSQRLTDYIYLGSLPTYQEGFPLDHSIRRVAQVLRALGKATNELADYYLKLRFTIPPTLEPYSPRQHGSPRPLPVPMHPIGSRVVPPYFQEYDVDGKNYTVNYESHLAPSFPAKAVFKGTVVGGGDKAMYDVVIKFTPVYCEDAHRALADMGRAPFLRFCKRVDNVGMYVVIMDYEDGEHADIPLEDEDHIEQLRMAVKALHDANYVHGDLRAPNALITTGGLKLIDFDWCGEEGKARYPADIFLAPDLGWHSGVRRGGLIKKCHDEHMFELMTGLTLRPDTGPRKPSTDENVPRGDSAKPGSGTELHKPSVGVADWGMVCGDC